ncbi:hypothetical protein GobsT_58530 [Gemmata obscuriglobus]|nr:hypothetical protein GobsT_58530 [Gemmata obscuriglobus]VTS10369.1 unnamed protein product [Gemmata obscuriglobus UQM 2246]
MTDGMQVTLNNVREAAQHVLAEFGGKRPPVLPEKLADYLSSGSATGTVYRIPVLNPRAGARVALVSPVLRGFIVVRLDRPPVEGAKVESIRTEGVPPSTHGAS